MIILEDQAQKADKHTLKNAYWKKHGIEVMRYGLPVGDYILADDRVMDVIARKKVRGIQPHKMDFLGSYSVCVDSKYGIEEISQNVCGKSHARFRDECILAMNNNIRLIVLIENEGKQIVPGVVNPTITRLEDLHKWINPRLFLRRHGKQLYPNAVRGATLMKACMSMKKRYNVDFLFCTPEESGKRIVEILTGGKNG